MPVNGALEVDFYGQACTESIGSRHVSGAGGQTEYVLGELALAAKKKNMSRGPCPLHPRKPFEKGLIPNFIWLLHGGRQ